MNSSENTLRTGVAVEVLLHEKCGGIVHDTRGVGGGGGIGPRNAFLESTTCKVVLLFKAWLCTRSLGLPGLLNQK